MGYEIKMIVGSASSHADSEWKLSDKRYSDDSGWEPVRDEAGEIVLTGRKEIYFQTMAVLDLCKIGTGPLRAVVEASKARAKAEAGERFHFRYADNGDDRIVEDRYGDVFWPVPVAGVLRALKANNRRDGYRRFAWAIALLESMVGDQQELTVLFYGH